MDRTEGARLCRASAAESVLAVRVPRRRRTTPTLVSLVLSTEYLVFVLSILSTGYFARVLKYNRRTTLGGAMNHQSSIAMSKLSARAARAIRECIALPGCRVQGAGCRV